MSTVKKIAKKSSTARMSNIKRMTKDEKLSALNKIQREKLAFENVRLAETVFLNLQAAEKRIPKAARPKVAAMRDRYFERFVTALGASLDARFGAKPKRGRPAKK